mgnify:CR=1 FL=1
MDHQTLSSTSILQEDDLQASLFKMVANAAYIGDDESDITCCTLIPFSFAVKDCHKDLKKVSRFHLDEKGGEGVLNGFIEKLNYLSTNPKI